MALTFGIRLTPMEKWYYTELVNKEQTKKTNIYIYNFLPSNPCNYGFNTTLIDFPMNIIYKGLQRSQISNVGLAYLFIWLYQYSLCFKSRTLFLCSIGHGL